MVKNIAYNLLLKHAAWRNIAACIYVGAVDKPVTDSTHIAVDRVVARRGNASCLALITIFQTFIRPHFLRYHAVNRGRLDRNTSPLAFNSRCSHRFLIALRQLGGHIFQVSASWIRAKLIEHDPIKAKIGSKGDDIGTDINVLPHNDYGHLHTKVGTGCAYLSNIGAKPLEAQPRTNTLVEFARGGITRNNEFDKLVAQVIDDAIREHGKIRAGDEGHTESGQFFKMGNEAMRKKRLSVAM